jgi:glyoxylase-like metal-dependent hydrolase (beta-lactamase superfamily II)
MKKTGIATALLGLLCMVGSTGAFAQVNKMFWTTSGFFGPFPITGLIPTIPKDKQRDVTIPVSMWIIDHPKGLVVFDTGNNVEITKDCVAYWNEGTCNFLKPNQTRADTIDMQLKKQGYSADQVKVVVTSHSHLDHAGNLKMFPNAIHVFQKAELYQGWWPEQFQGRTGPPFVKADLEGTRGYNFLELDGDYDLFGDGSIQILATPGHTIGHQSMKVTMKSGQAYLVSQDAVWMQENLDGHPAGLNFSVQAYTNSVNRLKFMRDLQQIPLFMAHDQDQYAKKGGRWYK